MSCSLTSLSAKAFFPRRCLLVFICALWLYCVSETALLYTQRRITFPLKLSVTHLGTLEPSAMGSQILGQYCRMAFSFSLLPLELSFDALSTFMSSPIAVGLVIDSENFAPCLSKNSGQHYAFHCHSHCPFCLCSHCSGHPPSVLPPSSTASHSRFVTWLKMM